MLNEETNKNHKFSEKRNVKFENDVVKMSAFT